MSQFRTELAQFIGSTRWFRHTFNRAVVYSEGIRYLMEEGQAYWLIDAIVTHLGSPEFQEACDLDERINLMHFWNLAVRPDRTASLKAVADVGEQPVVLQEVPFTDFPLEGIDVWAKNDCGQWTLLLPSEY